MISRAGLLWRRANRLIAAAGCASTARMLLLAKRARRLGSEAARVLRSVR